MDFFASRHWFNLLAKLLTNGAEAGLLMAKHQDGSAAGSLPILHSPQTYIVAALANYYSMRMPQLIAPGHYPAAVLTALFAALREKDFQRLNLSPLPANPSLSQQIAAALQRHGFSVATWPVSENWRLDCTNLTYTSFLEQRPTRLRHTIERRERKLRRNGNMKIKIIGGGDQALTLLVDF